MSDRPIDEETETLLDAFEFVDAGRTFTCGREAPRAARPDGWWWFRVKPDVRGQRYAPFRAAAGDTRAGVQARIVAYYDDLLHRRSQPATSSQWGRRTPPVPPVTTDGAGVA